MSLKVIQFWKKESDSVDLIDLVSFYNNGLSFL